MKVFGREIKFKRTVGATCRIAEACPDRDVKKIEAMFNENDIAMTQRSVALLIAALNEGYEQFKGFNEPGYEPNPLTIEQIMCLDQDTFNELANEAIEEFKAVNQTVEAVPKKNRAARRATQ